jgi:NAD+-dependent protein deacetylase SIR2
VSALKTVLEIIKSDNRPGENFTAAVNDMYLAAVKALDADPLTFDKLIDGMKLRKYSKIVFLTGAGISVASGIPDFRTPGSGLYAKVEAMGLSKPEAIFSIDYFRESPETFYTLAGSLMFHDAKPVKAHKFIKKIADEGLLLKCMTQNIDGLELDAGLDPSHLIQAHGHMRSARCCNCRIAVDIADFHKHVHEQKVLCCSQVGCSGIVKPDVTFFGEALPESFGTQVYLVRQADLVIVMGTSLSVHPFAKVLSLVSLSTPIVLINMENPGIVRPNFLFMPGCIEDGVQKICDSLNWKFDKKRTLDEQKEKEEG